MNRAVVSRLASYHFAPTPRAAQNLAAEGITADVRVVGNTVVDALFWGREILARGDPQMRARGLPTLDPRRKLILVTTHRRESFGPRMRAVCAAVRSTAEARADVEFLLPVHPNPRVIGAVRAELAGTPRVHLTEPLDYARLIAALEACHLVMTDSGGIQEEAPSLGKPVLVLREITERMEGIEAGTALLVGTDPQRVRGALDRLLDDRAAYDAMARTANPYGDGHAAARIVAALAGEG
jgi:UDP-N-acetylglucosamine 2-epimerase (non-hydrolysing)